MSDLVLEWTVGEGGAGNARSNFYCSTPPLSFLLPTPLVLISSSTQPSTVGKIKMAAMIFTENLLRIRSSKDTPVLQASDMINVTIQFVPTPQNPHKGKTLSYD